MLKKWLSSYSYPSTSAAPIAATTITLEGIQSVIHAWGFPIEGMVSHIFRIKHLNEILEQLKDWP